MQRYKADARALVLKSEACSMTEEETGECWNRTSEGCVFKKVPEVKTSLYIAFCSLYI